MSGFISLNNITAAICLNAIDTLEKGKCEILKNEGLSKINLSCESTMRRIVVFAFGVNFQKKLNSFSRQQWNCERCSSAVGARLLQVKKFPRKITYLSKISFKLPFDLFQRASASVHVRM